MFRVIYIDKNGYGHKGGFKSDKEANDWANAQKNTGIIPLSLMVWSEDVQCFKKLDDYMTVNQ